MKTFRRNFTRTTTGFQEVQANTEEEAKELLDNLEGDEFDKNSEYEFGETIEEREMK